MKHRPTDMLKMLSTSEEIQNFLGAEPLQAASLRVTMACNLKCQQCYAIAGKRLENELSLDEVKKLIKNLKAMGAIRIFFTGGEPFARPDMIDILEHTDRNSFAMYISTNGTLLTPQILERLGKLKHLRTFQISIDGLSGTHDQIRGVEGTFERAVSTIKLARKKISNAKIAIISTLMKDNFMDMEKIMKLAVELGVDTFGIVTLYPVKRSPQACDITTVQKHELFDKLAKLYNEKKTNLKIGLLIPPALIPSSLKEIEYGCGYVCSFPSLLGINANGDVAPCDGLLNYPEFILGNIRETPLKKIWNHPLMQNLREIRQEEIEGVCKKCKYLSFCMGGCRARAYLDYGSFRSPNPLCQSFYEGGWFPEESLMETRK